MAGWLRRHTSRIFYIWRLNRPRPSININMYICNIYTKNLQKISLHNTKNSMQINKSSIEKWFSTKIETVKMFALKLFIFIYMKYVAEIHF